MREEGLASWGLLLDTLSQISNVEVQVARQFIDPGSFLPETLIIQWESLFDEGDLLASGLSEVMVAVLSDFDFHLDHIADPLLPDASRVRASRFDYIEYIRHDDEWRSVREMADLTLTRLALLGIPDEPTVGVN